MRGSVRVALWFAVGAFVVDVLVACWVLDTYRHVPLPPFVKFFFYVGLWPSILAESSPLSYVDAAIFSPLVWGMVSFSFATLWQKAFRRGTPSVYPSERLCNKSFVSRTSEKPTLTIDLYGVFICGEGDSNLFLLLRNRFVRVFTQPRDGANVGPLQAPLLR